MSECIYLDYQATTPLDRRVADVMRPYIEDVFGNPHSEHTYGWEAAKAIDEARQEVARLIGADPSEIIFTAGATEANNLAIQGIARAANRRGNHIVVSAIEHKSVLATAAALEKSGFRIDVLPVQKSGIVDLDALQAKLSDDTALVSIMSANNEIGVLQPIEEIGALCRNRGIPFHTDAAQAVGKVAVDVFEQNIDMLSLSGHKMYGPKGIGAFYVSAAMASNLEPLIMGGAQQNGLRSGTLPTFLCVGLGEACRVASEDLAGDVTYATTLRDEFVKRLMDRFPNIEINGDRDQRLPGNINLRLPGIDADSLLTSLQGEIAASTGSACNTGIIEPSYVLIALGLSTEEANSSIRFGFGKQSTMENIICAADIISDRLNRFLSNQSAA